ncbi:MAG: GNAT family N-acetyltransferase [Actinobacteria bacterium]|nr:GNAT family N-acetyltransferase [Actinomycetota bacterium]
MDIAVRPCASPEELRDALNVISHYFGHENNDEDAERFAKWIEVDRVHAARDGDAIVGCAGAYTYRMAVPGGGSVPAGGVTIVGVLPTHRRRGVLTAMMRAQLADCRARGDAVAYLWASEATIYGRFGYGLASRQGSVELVKDRTRFVAPFEPRGSMRLLDLDEAVQLFPPLYEQVFAQRPGMFSRDAAWWETRRLNDDPSRRRGAGPLNRALLELDGKPAGYALYRVAQEWAFGSSSGKVTIQEVVTPTPEATRELWRWLLDFDWTSKFDADLLPLDHPLFLLLAEPRRMQFRVDDGVWVRILDIEAALTARSYNGDESTVLELADAFMPENAGRWRVGSAGVSRTEDAADLRLDITGLGTVYLGGFGFGDLVRGFRAEELKEGAAERADALFATGVEPWCAEIF